MVESFPMVPASAKALWFVGGLALLLAGFLGMLVYTGLSSRWVHFNVSSGGLEIVGDFWGRSVPAANLDLDAARAIDLDREPDLRPRRRTWGTGLPGYASGWFTLCNGQKALVYLTDPRQVVYVPTREGYSLLLSVNDPSRFLDSLRRTAVAGG